MPVFATLPNRACLRADALNVTVDGTLIRVDACEFEKLSLSDDRTDREQALVLYQGDLLDGLRIKEEGFETWLRPLRERLRARAIKLLVEALEAAGETEESIVIASRLLGLEPTNEAGHRALMRIYAAHGRENAAVKQFNICRNLLSQEFGIGPSQATVALFEEIKLKRWRHHDVVTSVAQEIPEPSQDDAAKAKMGHRKISDRKPTISVMPFENLSDEPGQDYFAAGITSDVIAALLRHRWLTVIGASNMLRSGRFAMIADGQVVENNVDYLITGNIRKAGNRVRISLQMLAADSSEHVWSNRYDREWGDILEIQDDIASVIASQLDTEINASERRRVLRRSTQNMSAWDCYHLGMTRYLKFTSSDAVEAQRMFARSLELDPDFGEGHAWWSYMNVLSTFYYDGEPSAELFDRVLRAAQRAVNIDDQNAMFHVLVARVYLARQEYAKGFAEMERAMELNPNLPSSYCGMGDALNYEGQYQEAIRQFDKALQLGPRDPVRWAYLGYGALTHLFAENFEAAIEWSEKAIRYPHCLFWAYAHRVAALGQLGRHDEAKYATRDLLQKRPDFSLSLATKKLYFIKRPEQLRLYLDGLAKAGIGA